MLGIALLGGALLGCAALATLAPLLGVSLAAFAGCVYFALESRKTAVSALLANLAAVFFALAAFEAYLWWQDEAGDGTRRDGTVTRGFTAPHPDLGYAPVPGRRVSARKYHGDTLLYDVSYTIGPDGLRDTPGPDQATVCVVFFGDSITFGEGVNDQETMPAFLAAATGGRAQARNFGFSGYGPHQMLAAIESGLLEKTVSCPPTHFVFLTIFTHVARSAGLASWDPHGPRYRLDGGAVPRRYGNFDSPPLAFSRWPVPAWAGWVLERSHAYQKFFGRGRAVTDADLELYLAIIARSRDLLAGRYPGSGFHVLLWADERGDPRVPVIASRLAGMGVAVHPRSRAVPEMHRNPSAYELSPHDRHPNAEGHRLAAEYVARAILKLPPAAQPPEAAGAR